MRYFVASLGYCAASLICGAACSPVRPEPPLALDFGHAELAKALEPICAAPPTLDGPSAGPNQGQTYRMLSCELAPRWQPGDRDADADADAAPRTMGGQLISAGDALIEVQLFAGVDGPDRGELAIDIVAALLRRPRDRIARLLPRSSGSFQSYLRGACIEGYDLGVVLGAPPARVALALVQIDVKKLRPPTVSTTYCQDSLVIDGRPQPLDRAERADTADTADTAR
jgi:hypothetical protein